MLIAIAIIAAAAISAFGIPKVAHASGFREGYEWAKMDAQTGENNNHCGFDNSDSYCFDLKAGYLAGQGASLLHN